MNNEVTYMHLKNILVLDNVFADFRSKCLECAKFTQGCQNQIFADQKQSFKDNMYCY